MKRYPAPYHIYHIALAGLLLVLCFVGNPVAHAQGNTNPSYPIVGEYLTQVARQNRIPSVLLKGLAWRMSGWRQGDERGIVTENDGRVGLLGVATAGRTPDDIARLRTDWRYNVTQGAKALVLAWNRAPIIGDGRLEDGRNILECWYFALGRYKMGKQGPDANAFADSVLDAVASGGATVPLWEPVVVNRPKPERMARSLNLFGAPAPWHFGDVQPRPAASVVVELPVPYLHQVYDSPPGFDRGEASCGPTSMIMTLAFFGKIAPRPLALNDGWNHVSQYGAWLPEVYAQVCEPDRGAVHAKMLTYLRQTLPDVAIYYDDKATYARVKSELDKGRPCILGTKVTRAGHIMVARGYQSDGRLLICDPAGDREQAARRNGNGLFSPTGVRYWNLDGGKAVYEWDALDVRWVITLGPQPDKSNGAEDTLAPLPTAAPARPNR